MFLPLGIQKMQKATKYTQARTLASITNFTPKDTLNLMHHQHLPTIILKLKETLENTTKFELNKQYRNEGDGINTVKFISPQSVCKNTNLVDLEKEYTINDILNEWQMTNLCNKNIIVFGGIDPRCPQTNDGQGKTVLMYNSNTNEWDHLSTMPGSRHHHSAVLCNGRIYVLGGTRPAFHRQKPNITQTVWSFDPNSLQWCLERSLPFPRRDFGLIATENGFYVIGGEEDPDKFPVSTTYFYDTKTKLWHRKASLNIPRSGLMVSLVSNNKFWAAGGIIETNGDLVLTDSIEEYNIDLDIWIEVGKLNKSRCYGKVCCVNNSGLYLIGGVGYENNVNARKLISLSSIEKYVPDKRNWVKIGDMTVARHGHDVISVHDKIIIIGGVSTETKIAYRTVECFSTRTHKLIKGIVSLPNPTSGLSAIVMDITNKLSEAESNELRGF